jgi:amino-acid N-acetyltransferase
MIDVFPRPPEQSVRRLLEEARLPTADLTAGHFEHFFACGAKDAPDGVVGIELRGREALLRSLAVAKSVQNKGCGGALVDAAERHARDHGARRMYLLTTTAENFFARRGYRTLAREAAPESIRATDEFTTLCSSSAKLMTKSLVPWTLGSIIGYTLLVALVFIAVDIAVGLSIGIFLARGDPAFDWDEWGAGLGEDGIYISLSSIAVALVCIPLVKALVARRSVAPPELLGLRQVDARVIVSWCITLGIFVLASDLLTTSLGRPIVPDFMTQVYARSPPLLLLVALVVAAPAFEEVFFRGLLTGALRATGAPLLVAAVVPALVWAAIHLQYDLYGIGTIFIMGLLLSAARLKTGSVAPCIAMHCLANAIAFVETVWMSRGGAL